MSRRDRNALNSLERMAQQVLALDPHTGAIFCFRGHKGHIIKILAHDDREFCLFTKRLTDGCFAWPTTKEQVSVSLTGRRSFRCFWGDRLAPAEQDLSTAFGRLISTFLIDLC
ncbi:MAG: IS66 family insertion sequence element accessory protein TnpB [Mesorhizobium sp.]|uniref:IS66 family insertion sequence element accessory protein TnpB n=1 Tax=Mesorhizobium sp. TaxID=1871066 RepID=UPI00121AF43A|nr:IS66 family insertion sequence element accessory protein TnpB [Mesorhizobium sp.]TIN32416.1 MAG: IS66 family insertion sequence element accessory protein TnpB [Mesorhizobium sp.]TJU83695.1 MAG: IS66 family insertion sequence element accessory protein TnpB [Mesorhizobium sp.]